jgi:hypothetical protein
MIAPAPGQHLVEMKNGNVSHYMRTAAYWAGADPE